MAYIVNNVKNFKMSDVLTTSDRYNISLVDMFVDRNLIEKNKKLINQSKASYLFQIYLTPDIRGVLDTKIFGYRLSIRSVAGDDVKKLKDIDVSFFDDFPDIINTGEKDFDLLKAHVLKPEPVIVDRGSITRSDLNVTLDQTKIDLKPDSLVQANPFLKDIAKGDPDVKFSQSNLNLLKAGKSPDDLAELAMPSVQVPDTGYHQSITKSKDYLLPKSPGSFSLNEDRQSRMEALFPPDDSLEAKVHQFVSIEDPDDSTSLSANILYVQNPYFNHVRRVEVPSYMLAPGRELIFGFTPIVFDTNGDANQKKDYYVEKNSQTTSVQVYHTPMIQSLLEPEVAPTVRATLQRPGIIGYSVRKNDPVTYGIQVKLDYIDQRTGQVVIGQSTDHRFDSIQTNEVHGLFRNCLNRSPLIPRLTAITHSPKSSLSTQTICHSHPSPYATDLLSNSVTIYGVNNLDGIKLEIENKSPTIKSMVVLRENLSVPVNCPTRISEVLEINEQVTGVSTVLDDEVVLGHSYRYFVKANLAIADPTFQGGTSRASYEIICANDEFIKRTTPTDASKLYALSINKHPGGVAIFTPTAVIPDTGFSFFLEKIKNLGVEDQFTDVLAANRSKLTEIAFFLVERVDKSTNARLGFVPVAAGDVFTDPSASPFKRYMYIFRLALVNLEAAVTAASVLGEAAHTVESDPAVQAAVTKIYENFTASSGVIPEATQVVSVTPGELIEASLTGLEMSVNVEPNLEKIAPEIISTQVVPGFGSATFMKPSSLKLNWSINADILSEIDSFYVYCEYEGVTTVIKTVSATELIGTYSAIDVKYYNKVGQKYYYVKAKYIDGIFGPSSEKIGKYLSTSIPDDLMDETVTTTSGVGISESKKIPLSEILDLPALPGIF